MHNGKKNFLVIISARHHSEKCCSRQCGHSQLLVQNKKHIQKSTFLIIQKPTSKAHRNQVPFIHSRIVNLLIISHFVHGWWSCRKSAHVNSKVKELANNSPPFSWNILLYFPLPCNSSNSSFRQKVLFTLGSYNKSFAVSSSWSRYSVLSHCVVDQYS